MVSGDRKRTLHESAPGLVVAVEELVARPAFVGVVTGGHDEAGHRGHQLGSGPGSLELAASCDVSGHDDGGAPDGSDRLLRRRT